MKELDREVINIISKTINVPVNSLKIDSCISNPSEWDSVAHTNLVLALEEYFNIDFEFDELEIITSVESIVQSIEKKYK